MASVHSPPWGVHELLAEEVRAFGRLLNLKLHEVKARVSLCARVRNLIESALSVVTVLYGSFAYGTSAPTSAVDILCENCGDVTAVHSLLCDLKGVGEVRNVVLRPSSGVASLEVHADGVVGKVTFLAVGGGSQLNAVHTMLGALKGNSALRPVIAVLRAALSAAGLMDSSKGGFTGYAVASLVVFAAMCARTDDPAALLIHIFWLFGTKFNYRSQAASLLEGRVTTKGPHHPKDSLYLVGRLDPSVNLTASVNPDRFRSFCEASFHAVKEGRGTLSRIIPPEAYRDRLEDSEADEALSPRAAVIGAQSSSSSASSSMGGSIWGSDASTIFSRWDRELSDTPAPDIP
eukprot:Sspe_Gene.56987::Locus_31302_Transcript_1_1_Confidence_1.000_Length_1353::g.56987::m.56987/K03514/PAPD5_7, TRF4; non-canonical poly(A) RNA polymerase PAPD5/7